jgi:spore coat polysaccharide biosynthesis predicted glycosyltransferase SpsG
MPVAANQLASAETLERMKAAKFFAAPQELFTSESRREELALEATALAQLPSERNELSERSRALMDARGAQRVVAALSDAMFSRRDSLEFTA